MNKILGSSKKHTRNISALSSVAIAVIIIIIVAIAGVGVYFLLATSSTTSTTTTTTTTTTASAAPTVTTTQTTTTTTTSSTPTTLANIKIGTATNIGALPFYVAQEEGFFKQNGLNVTLVPFPSISVGSTALLGNSVQFTYMTYSIAIARASSQGVYLKIIAPLGNDGTYNGTTYAQDLFVVSPSITTAQDLKGKTVAAISSSGTDTLFTIAQLDKLGLNVSTDLKFIYTPTSTMFAAMKSGEVQGAIAAEPYATEIILAGLGHKFLNSNFGINATIIPAECVAATEGYVNANPQVAHAVFLAITQAEEWMADHQTNVQTILGGYSGLNSTIISAIWAGNNQGAFIPYPNGYTNLGAVEQMQTVLLDQGAIKTPVNITRLFQVPWYTP